MDEEVDLWRQQIAAYALGRIGPASAPALPDLRRAATELERRHRDYIREHPTPNPDRPFDRQASRLKYYHREIVSAIDAIENGQPTETNAP